MQALGVAQLNSYLRELLEADEIVRNIWVVGEISEFRRYPSGHCYFTLKDEGATLRGVMWRTFADRHPSLPRVGDAVLAHGKVSIYESRGELQLVVDTIMPAGVGLLNARFEELKQRLAAEGLFNPERKRPLPDLPRRIGIVTSPQAAALQDMLNILRRRFPLTEVVIAPCLVQGERAPDSIVEALYAIYQTEVDLIILARGGGSIEDLWCFNDEAVARAVFASPVPLITGVGHETDTTIVDFVADLRAPTPSAAAELAVPAMSMLGDQIAYMRSRLHMGVALQPRRAQCERLIQRMNLVAPLRRVAQDRQQLDDLARRLTARMTRSTALHQSHLRGLQAQLRALSPYATLMRGYALVRRASDGHLLTHPDQVLPGDTLIITTRAGDLHAQVVPPTDQEERR
ncbi:exodeoxyribonuclease VII, large subunit [Oscillochloris trichoides DG-6]|uniref:Exodeoxyribonuclease 7 large subunit n=1 Tax=Oscillochloris trichoides DG-6 TaxID=765420 RepID=E1IH46_9CHLR|nr:exodeoxyribonuclease VII large subunit [Oscillochloris trichoides]EFO79521.1 exodeoxyribonuclease VII, large subunit [Oscillochloris trichoides DG-6]